MKNLNKLYLFGALALILLGLACGGGGGGGVASTSIVGTGNGGTKVKVSGSIDAFGSVFVGGIRFTTDELDVSLEGVSGNVNDLELGMWVEVEGFYESGATVGTATNIIYNSHHAGEIDVLNSDNTFQINNIVITTDARTHVSYELSSRELALGMDVVVAGSYMNDGGFRATYIGPNETGEEFETLESEFTYAFEEEFDIHSFEIELEDQLSDFVFEAEGLTFDFSEATDVFESGFVEVGDYVIVTGEVESDVLVVDQYALLEEEDFEIDDLEGEDEGLVTSIEEDRLIINGENYFFNGFTYFEDDSSIETRQFGPDELSVGDFLYIYYVEGDEGERIAEYVFREDDPDGDLD